jgi:hypothetical protein
MLALVRLGVFVGAFVVMRVPFRGDVANYYYPQAVDARAGLMPYRDFPSSYAPLFSPLASVLLGVWNSPGILILAAIVAELLAVWLWVRAAWEILPDPEVRTAAYLYATALLPLVNVALNGQNQVWASVFLGLAVWLLVRGRSFLSGAAFGASLALVKFLPVIFAPCLFRVARARAWWAAGAVLPVAVVYGFFYWRGADVTYPFRAEGSVQTSGNLWHLATFYDPDALARIGSTWVNLISLAVMGVVYLALMARYDPERPLGLFAMITCAMMLLLLISKKSYPTYWNMAFFPTCAVVASGRGRGAWPTFLAFYAATTWIQVTYQVHHFLVQCLCLAGYAWLLWLSWRSMRRLESPKLKWEGSPPCPAVS